MAPPRLTDKQKHDLEAALAAALLLRYRKRAAAAQQKLKVPVTLPKGAGTKVAAFAATRAALIQSGTNAVIDRALEDSPSDPVAALADARSSIDAYNDATLIPFMLAWAEQQGLVDVYDQTPNPDDPSQSMRDAVLWEWVQQDFFEDVCAEASDASPASYEELTNITGGDPPLHPNCGCVIQPVG